MTTDQLSLTSNGYLLDMSPRRLGPLEPADPTAPIDELRARLHRDGFLWLPGFLDPAHVWDFRARHFEAHRPSGLLAEGSAAIDGIYSGRFDKEKAPSLYYEIARWGSYDALTADRKLVSFFQQLLGGETYLHRRKLIRFVPPGSGSTAAHYDLTYFRKGTDRILTAWIPLGDIPREMGGLVYLEGSHVWGKQMEAEFTELNRHLPPEERVSAFNKNMEAGGNLTPDLPALAEKFDTRWLCADYSAGDIVVHTSYAIHASTDNIDPAGRIRLSSDIRYQLMSDAIDERWAEEVLPRHVGVI